MDDEKISEPRGNSFGPDSFEFGPDGELLIDVAALMDDICWGDTLALKEMMLRKIAEKS